MQQARRGTYLHPSITESIELDFKPVELEVARVVAVEVLATSHGYAKQTQAHGGSASISYAVTASTADFVYIVLAISGIKE